MEALVSLSFGTQGLSGAGVYAGRSRTMRVESMLPMLFTVLACIGCAGRLARSQPVPGPPVLAPRASATSKAIASGASEPATTDLAAADRTFDDSLKDPPRGAQFDVERQVAVLRQAVLLYEQFVERAEGRPELEPAVRKSRERIADANQTIEFLLGTLSPRQVR